MKSKPMPFAAEVVCSFKTVRTAPLSPFVWVLLKTLKVFEVGERPGWEDLAAKLAIGESSFFREGWAELCANNLAGDANFAVAEITSEGEQSLEDGFIRIGEPRCRTQEVVYFRLDNGEPINWKEKFEAKNRSKLIRPKWADKLNEGLIQEALETQRESQDERITAGEKMFDLAIHWEESSRVKLD